MKRTVLFFLIIITADFFAQGGVTAQGGAYFPVGEFSNTYKAAGYGGEITFNFIENSSMEIGLTTGYSRFEADEDALKNLLAEQLSQGGSKDEPLITLDLEAPVQIYPLALTIKYLLKGRKWKPFFAFDAGMFFYDLTPKGTLRIGDETFDLPAEVEKEHSTMLALSFGTKYKINRKFYLVGDVKWSIYNNIKKLEADVDEKIKSIDKTVQTIGVLVGVNYNF